MKLTPAVLDQCLICLAVNLLGRMSLESSMIDPQFPYGFDPTMSLQQMAEALREVQGVCSECGSKPAQGADQYRGDMCYRCMMISLDESEDKQPEEDNATTD